MANLIDVAALADLIGDTRLRIADTRFDLRDPAAGRRAYNEGHVPGAVFFDLDEDLSTPNPPGTPGGRHPLPAVERFAAKLGRRGFGNDHLIVVYDDSAGAFAGRMWWMLKYLGHDDVRVLDGDFTAWLEAGLKVESRAPNYPATRFSAAPRLDMVADAEDVKRALHDPEVLLIDARTPERFRGDSEPLDIKPGHIPSAVNMPLSGNLQSRRFLNTAQLRERYASAIDAREVIAYCGSGVSAAHTLLALDQAGVKGTKLYVGSWSDWSSDPDNPVAAGEEDTLGG